jgi:hypothetical protein
MKALCAPGRFVLVRTADKGESTSSSMAASIESIRPNQ